MPKRRNFLKALTVGAVALGIGTVEAVKAAPVVEAKTTGLPTTLAEWQKSAGFEEERRLAMEEEVARIKAEPWYREIVRQQVLAQLSGESGYAVQQELAKLRGQIVDMPQDWTITPMSYSYVDPASILPVWKDGQLSKVGLDMAKERLDPRYPYHLIDSVLDHDA